MYWVFYKFYVLLLIKCSFCIEKEEEEEEEERCDLYLILENIMHIQIRSDVCQKETK